MTTDVNTDIAAVIGLYMKRWNIEVTFREGRDYLGVETQREWSDLSIERSMQLLFILIGNELNKTKAVLAESTA